MPQQIRVKTILNKKKKRDPWFLDDYTLNAYSGCSFNCLYCYIRGSKYGEHMEEKVSVKSNAVELLERQLHNLSKKGQHGIIVMSSATDPYLHFEKELGLTRELLKVIARYRFPLHMVTKSDLVVRDFDLLKQVEKNAVIPADLHGRLAKGCIVTFSFSTTNDGISEIFEPGATLPSLRLETLEAASRHAFLTGVSLMPLLPYITDTGEHLEEMFLAIKRAGAKYVMPATLTLFGNGTSDSKTLVLRAVSKHYPHLLEKYQRFFSSSMQMPAYYQSAFSKKTGELCLKYGLRNRIC